MRIFFLFLMLILLPFKTSADSHNTVPYSNFSEYERDYYTRVFNYTMDNLTANESYHWNTGVIQGDIHIGKKYLSKSKSTCRNFTETFTIGKQTKKNEGTACKRSDKEGWCRLNREDAHTCALEAPQTTTEQIIDNVETTIRNSNEIIRNTKDWWNR